MTDFPDDTVLEPVINQAVEAKCAEMGAVVEGWAGVIVIQALNEDGTIDERLQIVDSGMAPHRFAGLAAAMQSYASARFEYRLQWAEEIEGDD